MKFRAKFLLLLLLFRAECVHSITLSPTPACAQKVEELGSRKMTAFESFEYEPLKFPAINGALATSVGPFDMAKNIRHFRKTGRLLFEDTSKPAPGKEFFASNEFDVFKMGIDRKQTDLILTFAKNNSWDLAVQKNTKAIIFADWSLSTLQVQEYLFKPLILTARNPSEFISWIAGIPVPEALHSESIEKTFEFIDSFNKTPFLLHPHVFENQRTFLENILKRLAANPKVNDEQLKFVAGYLNHQLAMNFRILHPVGDFIYDRKAFPFTSERINTLFYFFKNRYDPRELLKAGATAEMVSDPFFSIVSSKVAFHKLQLLFDGNIFYMRADFHNPETYLAAKKIADAHDLKDVTISGTNILDLSTASGTEVATPQEIRNYLYMIARVFKPSQTQPLSF